MPKHAGQKIGQGDPDHEENGQMKIHAAIIGRAAPDALR
jgi:hypothetical protein